MANTVFVQLASYRDPQLIPTLRDLIDNAEHPEWLRVVVCWQHGEDEVIEDFIERGFCIDACEQRYDKIHVLTYGKASIELIDIPYLSTHGACWARHKIQQYYGGERYTLQLDSHHRFVSGWDRIVIEMLESLREESAKPVLTAYLAPFDPDNDPAGRYGAPLQIRFDRFTQEGEILCRSAQIDHWERYEKPLPARFYSGHFTFADGSFAVAVQHDPEYFFHGEEISIGVRAFTHGYDLYHPHRVIAWHEYVRKGRVKMWDDHSSDRKVAGEIAESWYERNDKCLKRNRVLFGLDEDSSHIDFKHYGFGLVRTLKQFEEYAGISFKYCGVQQTVLDGMSPVRDYRTYDIEAEWLDTLLRSNNIRICIHRKDLGEVLEEHAFWYVGVHDAADKEMHRTDIDLNQVHQHLEKEWVIYHLAFFSDLTRMPKTYSVLPYSKVSGWGKKTIRPVA